MKALFASLFAALFALSAVAVHAASIVKHDSGAVVVMNDEDKKDEAKPEGDKQNEEDKQKEEGEKKAD